jgi:hypothetical protein
MSDAEAKNVHMDIICLDTSPGLKRCESEMRVGEHDEWAEAYLMSVSELM